MGRTHVHVHRRSPSATPEDDEDGLVQLEDLDELESSTDLMEVEDLVHVDHPISPTLRPLPAELVFVELPRTNLSGKAIHQPIHERASRVEVPPSGNQGVIVISDDEDSTPTKPPRIRSVAHSNLRNPPSVPKRQHPSSSSSTSTRAYIPSTSSSSTRTSLSKEFVSSKRRKLNSPSPEIIVISSDDDSSGSVYEDEVFRSPSPTPRKGSKSPIKFAKKKLDSATWHVSTTPHVAQVAQPHLLQDLKVVGEPLDTFPFDRAASKRVVKRLLDIQDKHREIEWGPPFGDASQMKRYQRVFIEGVTYSPGDIVYIAVGQDDQKNRQTNAAEDASRSENEIANAMWFAEIIHLFEGELEAVSRKNAKEEKKYRMVAHVRWFQHGSKSILRETANTQEVFLLNECDDIPVETILGHCKMSLLPVAEDEPEYSGSVDEFFYRFLYLPDEAATISVEPHLNTKSHFLGACFNCILEEETEVFKTPRLVEQGQTIKYNGTHYHIGDFVYIVPRGSDPPALFSLGQIVAIPPPSMSSPKKVAPPVLRVQVQVLERSEGVGDDEFFDDRCLHYSDRIKEYDPQRFEGIFFARQRQSFPENEQVENWLAAPNHFYIAKNGVPAVTERCAECENANMRLRREMGAVIKEKKTLRALDIFSGCGGFSLGLDQTGFIETKWAIELEPSAARTLRENDPRIKVYNQDVNRMLEHTIARNSGERPHPLRDVYEQALPSMPSPGDIDLIYGGPPCQSFSGANTNKKADDPRHGLSLALLGFVEHYRPKYAMIENVRGMTYYSLVGRNGQPSKMGIVKVIMAVFHRLGYQTKLTILQAGSYGAPQSRRRLIILASLRDHPLPDFPLPTHAFLGSVHKVDLTDGCRFIPPGSGFAALSPVTTMDAISDLPVFNWKDPSNPTSPGRHHADQPGRYTALPYRCEPITRYQRWVRNQSERCEQHYAKTYTPDVIERVVHVPMRAGANYSDLPRRYQTAKFRQSYPYAYRRIDGDGAFPTSLTVLNPSCKYGECLHPTQKRVITLREYARTQGFPDTFKFLGDKIDALSRQIGNAVPVPLGLALGREFGKAVVKKIRQDQERPRPRPEDR